MNPAEANKFIHALNQIAEGVTLLGAAIEQSAWDSFEDHTGMPGVRPIAAAQLVQAPIQPADAPWGDQPEPQPADTPSTPDAPAVSLEQVRTVLADLTGRGMTAQVKALITQAGAEKLSAVEPGKYAWLLEQAKGLSDA